MKEEMMAIVTRMVSNGYCLFDETVEQFVDRMISYGFDVKFELEAEAHFMRLKGLT